MINDYNVAYNPLDITMMYMILLLFTLIHFGHSIPSTDIDPDFENKLDQVIQKHCEQNGKEFDTTKGHQQMVHHMDKDHNNKDTTVYTRYSNVIYKGFSKVILSTGDLNDVNIERHDEKHVSLTFNIAIHNLELQKTEVITLKSGYVYRYTSTGTDGKVDARMVITYSPYEKNKSDQNLIRVLKVVPCD